jgi:multidrug efflux pump subunit AcrA (membrane-fusion protein)
MREQFPIVVMPSISDSKSRLRRSSAVLKIILLVVVLGLCWASFSDLDQVVTTEAKIIPFEKLQTVQHFEGGIVEKIFVRAGDIVRAGDPLMTLNAVEASGGYQSKKTEVLALAAKVKRLEAQANNSRLEFGPQLEREIPAVLITERELLKSHQSQQDSAVNALVSQQKQRQSELEAARQQLLLISEERRTIEQLVSRGLEPRLEAIRIEKAYLEAEHRVRSAQDSILEIDSRIAVVKQDSRTASLGELTRAMTDLKQS